MISFVCLFVLLFLLYTWVVKPLFSFHHLKFFHLHQYKRNNNKKSESKEDYDTNDWPLCELIDTVYMKCLLYTSKDDLTKFLANQLDESPNASDDKREVNCFKLPNHCNVEECETVLRQFRKYSEMVLLYKSHNQYRKALELMKIKATETDGLAKTIEYLQELGRSNTNTNYNEKLILHFSEWVLKENSDKGLHIFSGKPCGSTVKDGSDLKLPAISSNKILHHLERIRCDISTRIGYLKMLINETSAIIEYKLENGGIDDHCRDVVWQQLQYSLSKLQSILAHETKLKPSDVNKYSEILMKQECKQCNCDVNLSSRVSSDESDDSDDSDDDNFDYTMKNALVLTICVSKYDGDIFEDLKGAVTDMKWLKQLWNDSFHFKMISNDGQNDNENKNNGDGDEIDTNLYYVTENDFVSLLAETRLRLLKSIKAGENFDGFVFVFSGHGYKDGIITSDNKRIKTDYIEKYFSAKEIPLFKDKPKIYIIDACRSIRGVLPITDEKGDSRYVEHRAGNVNKLKRYKYYHPFSNTLTIYGNTQGYGVSGSEKGGSLITTMSNYLMQCVGKNEKSKEKNKKGILSRKTFHQLLNPIKIELHRKQGGNQTVEINDTLLGYDLYINVNSK